VTVEELHDQARGVQAREVERHPWMRDLAIAGLGWATVELERAERELEPLGCTGWDAGPRDELLGATVRRCRDEGVQLVLLEPDTEGRLAAFLVRFGEGLGAVYLGHAAPPATGDPTPHGADASALGPRALGPLGTGRLLLGQPAWGPHVIVLDPGGSRD
jgi:hypothetical protein